MAKYKVGDRVRVRSDLERGKRYEMADQVNPDAAVSEMEELRGLVVTIASVGQKYCIEEDDGNWFWTDDMFTGLDRNKPLPELKTGMVLEVKWSGLGVKQYLILNDTPTGNWAASLSDGGTDSVEGILRDTAGAQVVRVFSAPKRPHGMLKLSCDCREVIWQASEPAKKMTVAEVADALGYKVEIVEG